MIPRRPQVLRTIQDDHIDRSVHLPTGNITQSCLGRVCPGRWSVNTIVPIYERHFYVDIRILQTGLLYSVAKGGGSDVSLQVPSNDVRVT